MTCRLLSSPPRRRRVVCTLRLAYYIHPSGLELGHLKTPFSCCCCCCAFPKSAQLQRLRQSAYIAKLGVWDYEDKIQESTPVAAVDVVMPAPPQPQPPPVPVVRIGRLALAGADAVVCLWIASLWVLLASVAAVLIGRLACGGWGCPAVGAAWMAVLVSLLFVAIVWPLAALLLSRFVEPFYIDQLEKGAAALEPLSDAVINAHLIATVVFASLEAFGFLLKLLALGTKDSSTDRTASAIMCVLPLGIIFMCCFVSIPGLAARVWRMRRHGSASVVPI